MNFKAIVWDKSLAGPIGLVAKYSLLQEHDVIKMYPLGGGPLPQINVANIIFITRPQLDLMDLIAEIVHGLVIENNLIYSIFKQLFTKFTLI